MNELYFLLRDWEQSDKMRLMVASGIINRKVIDWLTIYESYKRLREQGFKKMVSVTNTADNYKISDRTVLSIVDFFEKPIKQFVAGNFSNVKF